MMDKSDDEKYEELLKSMAFDRKVDRLSKVLEERRQEDIAWMEAAYNG